MCYNEEKEVVLMEIRKAQEQDIPKILLLLQQIGQLHAQLRPDIFRADAQKFDHKQVLDLMENPDTPVFVAVESGDVVGYSFCQIKRVRNHSVLQDQTTLYIDDLCVDETCRGQKTGTRMMEKMKEFAQAEGCDSVTLNVWSCNEKAAAFYRSLGMREQRVCMEWTLEA